MDSTLPFIKANYAFRSLNSDFILSFNLPLVFRFPWISNVKAVAHSGELTNLVKREEILRIGQNQDRTPLPHYGLIELVLIRPPFFIIQSNDHLYPNPARARDLGTADNETKTILATYLTVIALVLHFIINS